MASDSKTMTSDILNPAASETGKFSFALRPVCQDDDPDVESCKRPWIYVSDYEEITLGRCRLTQIRDVELSRKQVRIKSNGSPDSLEITQLSKALSSFINGQPLLFPWSRTILVGDSICLRKGRHEYKLERCEAKPSLTSNTTVTAPSTKKRRATDAFETQTPANNVFKKRSRGSLQFTPIDLARQLNTFGSTGKITSPG